MEWNSAISNHPDLTKALASCIETLEMTSEQPPDVIFVFASPHYGDALRGIAAVLRERFPQVNVLGTGGSGIIGGGHEVERGPALSLTAAALPGVDITPFHIDSERLQQLDAGRLNWADELSTDPSAVILFADPFSINVKALLQTLDDAYADATVVGGLASGGERPGDHRLILNQRTFDHGAVGLGLSGNLRVDVIVAQGCRAVGPPCFVTDVDERVLRTLDGQPSLTVLETICEELSPDDLALAKRALLVGLAMRPHQESHVSGDFLMRELLGALPDERALVVAAKLRMHDVLQFHVRDARAAWAELDALLAQYSEQERVPVGGLMFSCVGRGERLYGNPGHDIGVIQQHLGDLPIGGFFGNGELGPVGGRTWLHGYTTVLACFKAAADA